MHIKKLTTTNNTKTLKGDEFGYLTLILHLAPAKLSGYNTCPKASIDCTNLCLNTAGRPGIIKKGESTNAIQKARIEKTRFYFENPIGFYAQLYREIKAFIRKCERENKTPCIRLNGTSDIPKLALKVAKDFPSVQFYDYTKIVSTLFRDNLPPNYDLTFSRSESNAKEVIRALDLGYRVAVVADESLTDKELLEQLGLPENFPVFGGDDSDLIFLKPKHSIVRLKPKGKAKKIESGFVLRPKSKMEKLVNWLLTNEQGEQSGREIAFTKEQVDRYWAVL